jgi:hypothetical protein
MGVVLILTPIVVGSWPAIAVAAAGAATALGLVAKESVQEALQETEVNVEQSVEVELAENEVLAENLATGKEIVFTKGTVELRVHRDDRGRCSVCAKGAGHTKVELKQMAEQFSQKLTQCFVYNRVLSEVKSRNFQVINEEVMEDQSVRVHVRRWVD